MTCYTVRVYANEEICVEAENEEQAKEFAAEKSYFRTVEYCEIENIEE